MTDGTNLNFIPPRSRKILAGELGYYTQFVKPVPPGPFKSSFNPNPIHHTLPQGLNYTAIPLFGPPIIVKPFFQDKWPNPQAKIKPQIAEFGSSLINLTEVLGTKPFNQNEWLVFKRIRSLPWTSVGFFYNPVVPPFPTPRGVDICLDGFVEEISLKAKVDELNFSANIDSLQFPADGSECR